MFCAATFSVEKKHLNHVILGGSIIMLSVVIGGVIGYYVPSVGGFFAIQLGNFLENREPAVCNGFIEH
ncbi:hypothetical protein Lgra_0794 [Legionella gratiana]|uniref:Uncharacterized protein n=1 Tax=Legionella gratiana TaxID=45066 RepID=A0A378JMQ9_9GAMM|nr:hypothetical protein [Legionella gratiana]KTD13659.1 hypothetical protein Lgra_0794 [Legionella gratiana]STX46030.1 Uncharacterised protein [Legionella gratiana]